MPDGTNGAWSTKRARRTKAEMAALREGLHELVRDHQPATLRNVFYLAESAGLIAKTEQEYHNAVGRIVGEMREAGTLPWDWIVDYTRVMRKPASYSGIADLLEQTSRLYRRQVWQDLPVRVEVWSEKESVTGVLLDVTAKYDVPLMPSRGYASKTFLRSSAMALRSYEKPTHIYNFGDHDPSGRDISRVTEERLRHYAGEGVEIHFRRVAVEPWQIEAMRLPTRPTKTKDPRAGKFEGRSVELEAIDPNTLRRLCQDCIERHIPDGALDAVKVAEESERMTLDALAGVYREDEAAAADPGDDDA